MWLPKKGEVFFHLSGRGETGMAKCLGSVTGQEARECIDSFGYSGATIRYSLLSVDGHEGVCRYPDLHIQTEEEGLRMLLAGRKELYEEGYEEGS